jgi:hypothetical protein
VERSFEGPVGGRCGPMGVGLYVELPLKLESFEMLGWSGSEGPL